MYYEKLDYSHLRTFDGVTDLIESVKQLPPGNNFSHWDGCLNQGSWLGRTFRSWDDVYAAGLEPWNEGLAVVDRMIRRLEAVDLPKPKSRKRRMRFDEADGDELDLDRLRDGQPFWRQAHRDLLSGPQTVVIVIDLNATAGTAHEDILWRGAAAIAMTHILEDAGFRVELWSVHCGNNCYDDSPRGHCNAVQLKQAGDLLDAGTLVSAVSGWFYRSLMFRAKWLNTDGRLTREATSTLGQPRAPYADEIRAFTRTDAAILISGCYSEHSAVWVAEEALKKLAGVEPPPEPEPLYDPEPVAVAQPVEPPKPLTKAELARQAAEQRRQDREYKKWAKAWAAKQRDA